MTDVEVSLEGDIVCGAVNGLKQGQVVSVQQREAAEDPGDAVNVDREKRRAKDTSLGYPNKNSCA